MEGAIRRVSERDSEADCSSKDLRSSSGFFKSSFNKEFSIKNSSNYSQEENLNTSLITAESSLRGSTNSTFSMRGSVGSSRGSQGCFTSDNLKNNNNLNGSINLISAKNNSYFDQTNISNCSELEENYDDIIEKLVLRRSMGIFNKGKNNKNIENKINEKIENSKDILAQISSTIEKLEVNKSPSIIKTETYKYIGETNKNHKREGFGVCQYQNGDKYTGYWSNNKKEGYGRYFMKASNKTFQGDFKTNQIDGFVEYINKNGVVHHGMMKNLKFLNCDVMIIRHPKFELNGFMEFSNSINKLTGVATIKYKNGVIYEGETLDNFENGWGITRNPDGSVLRAHKQIDSSISYCEINSPCEEKYFGWFRSNKRNGIGISISKEGIYSVGKYVEDLKEGGFLTCCKGEARLDLYLCGFLVKSVNKKEKIINYLNLVYPEYKWLCKANNQLLAEILIKA